MLNDTATIDTYIDADGHVYRQLSIPGNSTVNNGRIVLASILYFASMTPTQDEADAILNTLARQYDVQLGG